MTTRATDTAAREVANTGWTVVPALLAAHDRPPMAEALDEVFAAEDDIARDRGWLTDAYRVSYVLPAKHPAFVDLCTPPPALDLAIAVLGADCVLAGCNGLAMVPEGDGQRLHPDHRTPTPGTTLYLQVVVALDDFTVDNGATRVVSGTHQRTDLTDDDRPDLEEAAEVVELSAGDALAFDACLWHAAGPNRTTEPRRALHLFFARPWVRPHWDFAASLPAEIADQLSPEHRRLLGFADRPARFDAEGRRAVRGDQR